MTDRVSFTQRQLLTLFCLYIISLPLNGVSFYNLGDRGVARVDWMVGAILVAMFTLNLAFHNVKFRWSPISTAVTFYIFAALLSSINLFNAINAQLVDFFTKGIQLIIVTAVFFVISSLPINEKAVKTILKVWFITAVVTALYAFYQLLARRYGLPLAYFPLNNPSIVISGQTGRVFASYSQVPSFFKEPGFLGSYLLSPIFLFGIIMMGNKDRNVLFKSHRWNLILWFVILLAVVIAGSLGPYISIVITVSIMYGIKQINRVRLTKILLLGLVFLMIFIIVLELIGIGFFGIITTRFQGLILNIKNPQGTLDITSYKNRMVRAREALKVWLAHPVFGVGMNNTHFYTPEEVHHINSGWVQLLSDQGLVGFTSMLIVLFVIIRGLFKVLFLVPSNSWWYFLIVGMIVAVLADTVDTLVTYNWTHPLRWFTLSIANLVYIQAKSQFTTYKG